jgi:hypothetical protein
MIMIFRWLKANRAHQYYICIMLMSPFGIELTIYKAH